MVTKKITVPAEGSLSTTWQWAPYSELSKDELYEIMAARQEVFVVEQNIAALDADGRDQKSWHLVGWQGKANDRKLVAYLRVPLPGVRYDEHSIGRVLTMKSARGTGLGKIMTAVALENIQKTFGDIPIRISAQAYLEKFYSGFGFTAIGVPYIEEGISHIEMLRPI